MTTMGFLKLIVQFPSCPFERMYLFPQLRNKVASTLATMGDVGKEWLAKFSSY